MGSKNPRIPYEKGNPRSLYEKGIQIEEIDL